MRRQSKPNDTISSDAIEDGVTQVQVLNCLE